MRRWDCRRTHTARPGLPGGTLVVQATLTAEPNLNPSIPPSPPHPHPAPHRHYSAIPVLARHLECLCHAAQCWAEQGHAARRSCWARSSSFCWSGEPISIRFFSCGFAGIFLGNAGMT